MTARLVYAAFRLFPVLTCGILKMLFDWGTK